MRTRRWIVALLTGGALLALPAVATADGTPYQVLGDDAPNQFTITMTVNDTIEICQDGFCAEEIADAFDTIIVTGGAGDDVLAVDHDSFLTNGTGGIAVNFDGGVGNDHAQICPEGCPGAGIAATTYAPGAGAGEGTVTQSAGSETLQVTFQSISDVLDGSPGAATVEGTPADDVMTHGAGRDTAHARVAVGALVPYEFSRKDKLTVNGNQGADRLESDGPGAPEGLGGTCGGGQPVCFEGGSSAGDVLVVHGVAAVPDDVVLRPLGAGPFGQGTGTVTGVAGTAGVHYGGLERIEAPLQAGSDGDRFAFHGSAGDDRFELTPSTTPRRLAIDAVLSQGTVDASTVPHVVVSTASDSDVALVGLLAGAGDDQVVYTGTARDDGLALTPDELSHAIDGRSAYRVGLADVERTAPEGGDGDDALTVAGDVPAATSWGGGPGGDTLALEGTGAGALALSLADGSVRQDGFGTVTASGTETFGLRAGGSSVSLSGDAGAETLRFAPSAAGAGTVTRDGDPRTVRLSGVSGLLRIDPLAGSDTVVVRGSSASDQIPVTREPATDTLTAQVGSLLPARLAASTEAVRVEGAEGDDRFVLAGAGGPASVTVDGGADPSTDTLVATQDVTNATVAYATDPSSGIVDTAAPPVGFAGLETVEVEGDGTGTLMVTGSAAPDALTQLGNRVTAGPGAAVAFSRFPQLALDAGAGGDQVVVSPRGTSGVSAITVDAGAAADIVSVDGTALGEAIAYAPSAADAGQVDVAGAPPVRFASAEELTVDGRTAGPSGDALTIDTRALDGTQVLEPGSAFDAGTVRFRDGAGSSTTAPPVTFARLGMGSVAFDDDARDDRLVYRGSTTADVFRLDGGGDVRLNSQVPVSTTGIHTLVLDAQEGGDTFDLPAVQPFPGTGSAAVRLDGGGPDAGDVANVAGGGAKLTADLGAATLQADGSAPIALTGVERTNLDGASDLAVLGDGGPDVVRYTPTGAQAGTVARDGDAGELRFSALAGDLTADPRSGSDQVVANGRSSGDATAIMRGPITTVQVEALKALRVPTSAESLQVLGGDGADTTTVGGSGGPAALAVGGGLPAGAGDRLVLNSPAADVTFDATPPSGIVDTPGGRVGFFEMEGLDLEGDGSGGITVGGGGGADTINLGGQSSPQVGVDGGPVITYGGYRSMTIDGRGGDDHIDVSYVELGELASIRVIGGGGLGDQLTVSDQPGSARTLQVRPTAPDAGTFSLGAPPAQLAFESTEGLLVDGMGGPDELRLETPAGGQTVRVTPGAVDDAASLQLDALVPVRFQRLGLGRLRIADATGGRSDTVVYDGGPASDAFRVVGDPNAVTLNTRIPLLPDGAAHLALNGYEGDDAYELTGPLPFATTRADAGGPDRADALSITGPTGPVTANLGAGTVDGYGGTLDLAGLERLTTDIGGGTLTQVGRAQDDALCYDAMTPRDGRAYVVGAPGAGSVATSCTVDQRGTNLLHEFLDVGRLLLDPAGGSDQVIVNGSPAADLITLDLTVPTAAVTLHPDRSNPAAFRLPAEVLVDSTESLAVAADNGADALDVTVHNNAAPVVFLDGEDPNPKREGDDLVVRDGTGRVGYSHITGHEFGTGTVFAGYRDAFSQRIDYVRIEGVKLYRDPKA
jgi:hypothetical protein